MTKCWKKRWVVVFFIVDKLTFDVADLHIQNLATWMPTINNQPFATSPESLQLMDIVTSLVSRDKLIEWEMFASEVSENTIYLRQSCSILLL